MHDPKINPPVLERKHEALARQLSCSYLSSSSSSRLFTVCALFSLVIFCRR